MKDKRNLSGPTQVTLKAQVTPADGGFDLALTRME